LGRDGVRRRGRAKVRVSLYRGLEHTLAMSTYRVIARAHVHRPASALATFLASSEVKSGMALPLLRDLGQPELERFRLELEG
jgi:hypothetical protein